MSLKRIRRPNNSNLGAKEEEVLPYHTKKPILFVYGKNKSICLMKKKKPQFAG